MADRLNVGVGESVLPGDIVNLDFVKAENKTKLVLGPGLQHQADSVIVTKPGVLRSRDPAVLWIDSHQKRVRITAKARQCGPSKCLCSPSTSSDPGLG
jgi:Exosome complex exonuclease Rrp40 N-terminal domain